jgi:hypothetical protein
MSETPTAAALISATLSPAAARMRRHRERRRDGLRCLTVEIRESELDALVLRGLLPEDSRNDRNAVLQALYSFLEQELDSES